MTEDLSLRAEFLDFAQACVDRYPLLRINNGFQDWKNVIAGKISDLEKKLEMADQVESNLSLEIDRLAELLPKLKRNHYECEDCYYSCPKCKEGCCDEREGDQCTCGADKHNALVDEAIKITDGLLKEATEINELGAQEAERRDKK